MKTNNLSFLLPLTLAITFAQPQSFKVVGNGSATSSRGIKLRYQTRLEPASPAEMVNRLGSGVRTGTGKFNRAVDNFSRILYDDDQYFGYDFQMEQIPGTSQIRVSILPLSTQPSDLDSHSNRLRKPVAIPTYPPSQMVEDGTTIAVDLLVNSVTGQKLVDYLTIRGTPDPQSKKEPRNFTIDDAEIDLNSPHLLVNQQQTGHISARVSGAVAWIYIPSYGRFILSLAPKRGYVFQQAGSINGKSIEFSWGGVKYQLDSQTPVVGGGPFHLYVMRDLNYRPSGMEAGVFHIGAADKVQYIAKP